MNQAEEELILIAVDYRPRDHTIRHRGSFHEVVGVIEEVAVCKCVRNLPFKDCPFTAVIKKDGEWENTSCYEDSTAAAFLMGLGYLHAGHNSNFAFFAKRMLGINKQP
jgi:hypothetical protein